MKIVRKKLLALILALAMCLSLLPAGALAADEGAVSISPKANRTIRDNDTLDTGNESKLRLKWAKGAGFNRVVLLQFPLDDIPGDGDIEAFLRLYAATVEASFALDEGMWLYATTQTPSDETFAAATALCTEENKVDQIETLNAESWLEVDVSTTVKKAKSENASQLTFIFKCTKFSTNGTNGVEFYSTQHSDTNLHPTLTISASVAITEISAIEAETAVGVAPRLPDHVDATYSNGDVRSVAVTWDTDSVDFNQVGTVVVLGTVSGTEIKAQATVRIKQNNIPSGDEILAVADVYVQAGKHADKTPALSTDGPGYISAKLRLKHSDNLNTQEYTRRIYLLYDLTGVDVAPHSAQIVLHLTNDAKNPEAGYTGGDVYVLTGDHTKDEFGEEAITWNSADIWESEKQGSFNGAVTDGAVYIDVTEAVETAVSDKKDSLGFMLEIPNVGAENGANFWSSRGATGAYEGKAPAMRFQGEPVIADVPGVEVSTEVGTAPTLPDTVTVNLSAGGTAEEAVTWGAIEESTYASIGTFVVTGSLNNYVNVTALATVTVTPPEGYTGTTYYLDATKGDDSNSGTSPDAAWKTLSKVNEVPAFLPGDQILLKRGEMWNGYLFPKGNGLPDAPITIAGYGEGNRPIINGGGTTYAKYSATVMLYNLSHWVVDGLEITNYGPEQEAGKVFSGYARAGIYVFACDQYRISEGFEIKNCYVHDIVSNTSDKLEGTSPKMTGGIIALAEFRDMNGNNVREQAGIDRDNNHRAGFRDIKIHNNIVLRTMHEGIRTKVEGVWGNADGYPRNASKVHIYDNYIEKTLGDGIVVGESNGDVVVERNVVKDAAYWSINSVYYAAVWCHYADNTLFQYNEIFGTRYGLGDGEAFDADNFCDGTIFQYNYTHDNWGGSALFMSSQTNSVFRYNISANDGTRSGEEILNAHSVDTVTLNPSVPNVYNNTFYIDKNAGKPFYGSTKANGFANFRNNIILAKDDTKTLTFIKGTAPESSIIENNLFSHEGIFTGKMPHSKETLLANNNIFGDPKLKNPAATAEHDAIDFTSMGGLSGVETMLKDPLAYMRSHAAEFAPAYDSPVLGAGMKIDECELSTDIMGNPIRTTPSIGAIEPANAPHQAAVPTITTDLPATKDVTAGQQLKLSVVATTSDGGTLTYQWYKDGTSISGATGSSYTVASAAAAHDGVYQVIITNTLDGTTATATSVECTVTVNPPSATPIDGSISITGDAKFGATLTAVTSEITPEEATLTYEWSRDDATVLGNEGTYAIVQDDIGHTITLTVSGTGEYSGSKTATTDTVAKADGPAAPEGNLFTVTKETALNAADGTIDGVTAEMEWSADTGNTWEVGNGDKLENLAHGNYLVRYSESDTHLAGAAQTLTVLAYDMTQEPTPEAEFDAADMTLINVSAGMEHSLDGGMTWALIEDESIVLNESEVTAAMGIQVRMPGNGSTTMDSEAQIIILTQAAVPTVLGLDETVDASGAITGTDATMEYRIRGNEAWVACSADSTEVSPGTYEVRIAGVGTVLASAAVQIEVNAYLPPAGTPVTGVTLSQTTATLYHNTTPQTLSLTATVEPADADNQNVSWSSSNDSVATVSENGLVTAVGNGMADITVTTEEGGFIATCIVTVETYTPTYTPPAPSKPAVTENEDGSTTTKVTDRKTGTVTETTEYPDGKVIEEIVKKDGTTEKIVTEADGKKIQAVVTPEGDKSIAVTSSDGVKVADVVLPAQVEKPAEPFADVPEKHWAKDSVELMAGMGLMDGVGQGAFASEASVTRGMLVTMLHRLSGELSGDEVAFEDVAEGQWYTDAVSWAASCGIIKGVSADSFQPVGELTRESLVVMLYRYASLLGLDVDVEDKTMNYYTDAEQVSGWANDAMDWALEYGIITGGDRGRLEPEASVSRAETAVILTRLLTLMR